MNRQSFLLLGFLISQSALAAMSPASAKKQDEVREGNLAESAIAYFKSNIESTDKTCGFPEGFDNTTPAYAVQKVGSFSSVVNRNAAEFDYDATYIVTKACFMGSTQAGAARDAMEAVIVQCKRRGPLDEQGKVKATQPDLCQLNLKLNVNDLAVQY